MSKHKHAVVYKLKHGFREFQDIMHTYFYPYMYTCVKIHVCIYICNSMHIFVVGKRRTV